MSKFLLHPLTWSLALIQISITVYAEQNNTDAVQEIEQLPTLVVKAEKQNEKFNSSQAITQFQHNLLDVPFNKSHLSVTELENYHIKNISDALSMVSGVFYQDSYGGGGWDNYSFRGFSTDPNMGTSNLRNGLSTIPGIHVPRDMVNVEAVDFLKGPMAAMYGQGAIGGVLHISTKQPEWETTRRLNLEAGTNDQYRAALDSTGAINDQIAYRLATSYENNHSFRNYVTNQHYFIAPQLVWKISEQTQLNLESEIGQYQYVFDRGIPMSNAGKILTDKKTFLGEPNDGDVKVNEQMYQLRLNHQLNENWDNTSAITYAQGQREGTSTEIASIHADLANRFRRYRKFNTETAQFQSILRGQFNTGTIAHEFVANVEASHYVIKQIQYRNASGINMPISLSSPVYGNILPLSRLTKHSKETQNNLALNIQDQIFLNSKWNILFGGRIDYMQQKIYDDKSAISDQKTYTPFSPRIGLNYQPTSALSFYSNWGKAFEMNTGLKESTGNLFDPETTQSWEIGGKYQYGMQNWLSLTYFDMRKQHLLTEGVFDSYVDNGEVKSQGLELNWQHQFFDALTLSANYSYTDAKVIKSETERSGARLKNIPKHAANLSGEYTFNLFGYASGLTSNVNYYAQRSANYKDNGTTLPSFLLLNLGAYTQLTPMLKVQLNIHNVFDRDYYVASYTNYWIMPGEPLKATVSLVFNF
ncbi:TonB-dependent receptor [Acinetobacter qingfengensis]|uniref:Ferrichrome-iron receptor n=1 Tax=Acinetobacter qingfengensis TaxID=1262585 RepID=A0A1E7R3D1_9GAMM|nr:TonB-dependent receptor [Acinetobacter qingfengensis]KAA8735581.1 TonB-dependent receptor [Acinetobacter qingfengensis]OEY93879.1 ferrichrome-iron receptor [Acinetobacter qingfengensis]